MDKEFTLKHWRQRERQPFTFDEWKEEKIPICPKSYFLEADNDRFIFLKGRDADLHEYWKTARFIDEEAFNKIDEAKREAFLIGAENTAEMMFRRFSDHIKEITEENVKAYTVNQIELCRDKLNVNRINKSDVLSGKVNKDLITPPLYKSLLDTQKRLKNDKSYIPQWPTIKKEHDNGAEWIDIKNDLFLGHVFYRYKLELESLDVGKESEEPNNTSQNDYGNHQKNKEWISNTFEEQAKKQPSQNKTAQKVQELYKQEFDLSISISTILRKAGRVD